MTDSTDALTKGETLEQHIARLQANPDRYVWVMTAFPEDVDRDGCQETYGGEGEAETVLASITNGIWADYCLRRGHATAERDDSNQWRCIIEPDWQAYRVWLMDDTPLDISKTLGELGLIGRGRRIQVRFERAGGEGVTAP